MEEQNPTVENAREINQLIGQPQNNQTPADTGRPPITVKLINNRPSKGQHRVLNNHLLGRARKDIIPIGQQKSYLVASDIDPLSRKQQLGLKAEARLFSAALAPSSDTELGPESNDILDSQDSQSSAKEPDDEDGDNDSSLDHLELRLSLTSGSDIFQKMNKKVNYSKKTATYIYG